MRFLNRQVEKLLSHWTVSSSSGLHLNFLDGLRGLAILMVIAGHAFYYNPAGPKFTIALGKIIGAGFMGVPIFFVLSGFLISYPFFRARVRDPGVWYQEGYASRRLLKILPPYYLATVVLAIFYYVRSRDPYYFTLGLEWAAGLGNFVYLPTYFNTSFWSLWVEIHFYVVLPLLFFLVRGAGVRTAGWLIFLLLAVVPPVVRQLTWPENAELLFTQFTMRRFPCAMDNFAWGVLFAAFYVERRGDLPKLRHLARIGYAGLLVIALSIGLFAWTDYHHELEMHPTRWYYEWSRFLPGLGAFLALFLAFDGQSLGNRLLTAPALRFVGIVSYEWFLIHQPVFFWVREQIGSTHGNLGFYVLSVSTPVAATFLVSVLVYHYFSYPIMRRGRSKLELKRRGDRQSAIAPRHAD